MLWLVLQIHSIKTIKVHNVYFYIILLKWRLDFCLTLLYLAFMLKCINQLKVTPQCV